MYEKQLSDAQKETLAELSGKRVKIKKEEFSLKLEEYVRKEKVEYITALIQLCELYDIDPENINKYLVEPIRQKIAEENGLLNSVYHINTSLPV
jgi:hypothetical protein